MFSSKLLEARCLRGVRWEKGGGRWVRVPPHLITGTPFPEGVPGVE